ncbi:hypothetical protein CB0940_03175 [Cercospora beticola]|uniref:Uncharacterized protein n=1 Tax=Cercospora beticola TaxID=122368 RepID=A0A2G5I6E2_CERBT|nr:hypothetical protein CB0940_03175 [Cercospora beticola]PIB00054.1 hypothetical protein CB0940_03175 [Cercospora beticola]WPB00344.1 hypothetical protein RHO25_004963 [Cercospora beticola]CAK1361451.1 unnamed protein product [Cercospora beticola]
MFFGLKKKEEPQPLKCDICKTWQPFRRFPCARIPRKCREHLSRENPFKDLVICKECLARKLEEQIEVKSPGRISCPICKCTWTPIEVLGCLGKDEEGRRRRREYDYKLHGRIERSSDSFRWTL